MTNPPKILHQHVLPFFSIIIILLQQVALTSSSPPPSPPPPPHAPPPPYMPPPPPPPYAPPPPSSSTCDEDGQKVIFSYPKFNKSSCKAGGGLMCMGATLPGEGFLYMPKVSPNISSTSNFNLTARVLYNKPIKIWPSSFCTSFSFKIIPQYNAIHKTGDGIAFVMAQHNNPSPPLSYGSRLGLQYPLTEGEREYLAEISTIGRLRHKNILQLQGWSHEDENLLLVYDFMPNKSLNEFITGQSLLDWKTRCKVTTGLASSLLYLHEECGDPIIHRDVKPSNVMLDAEFNPHLGDFGLARLLKNTTGVTTILAGTVGYMAPELIYTGKATTQSDVYSFGVVALELVSGKRVSNVILGEGCLVDYAWNMHIKGSLMECVDPKLNENFDKDQAIRILTLSLACLHLDSNLRPTMRKVIAILINSDETLIKLPDTRPRGVYVPLYGISDIT